MNSKLGKKKIDQINNTLGTAISDPSRYIPADIKREVRQRCGFGCVICGLPLYEYEHMNEWAIVKEHIAADITLLCDQHHREKTNGLLGIRAVRNADASPINKRGESKPYLFHVQPSNMTIEVGDLRFWYDHKNISPSMVVLSIDSKPVIWFSLQDDNLLLNLTLYDKSNKPILQVRDNELIYSTESWDITLIGKTLTIRSAARKIIISLTVWPNKNLISIEKAALCYNGYEVFIDEKGMSMPASVNGLRNCLVQGSGQLINYGGKSPGGMHFIGERSYKVV